MFTPITPTPSTSGDGAAMSDIVSYDYAAHVTFDSHCNVPHTTHVYGVQFDS